MTGIGDGDMQRKTLDSPLPAPVLASHVIAARIPYVRVEITRYRSEIVHNGKVIRHFTTLSPGHYFISNP